jgi:excisionase family DNA binding protein
MARGRRTDPAAAVLAKVMHEMGFPPTWIAELSQLPRKTVDDIIRGRELWAEMPRNELYDRTREQLRVLIGQITYSSAMKVMERLQARIDKASYMEVVSTMSTLKIFEVNQMNKNDERDIEEYLSTAGVMHVLEISRSTVYRLIAKGMPNIMVGSVHCFPIEQVSTWLKENYGDYRRSSRE